MARKIIILARQGMPSDTNFRVAYWLDVPAPRRPFHADATTKSEVGDATAGELNALTSGAVKEVVETLHQPNGTALGGIAAEAVKRFTQLQAELNNRNPWERYGTFWDGTSWTPKGVA